MFFIAYSGIKTLKLCCAFTAAARLRPGEEDADWMSTATRARCSTARRPRLALRSQPRLWGSRWLPMPRQHSSFSDGTAILEPACSPPRIANLEIRREVSGAVSRRHLQRCTAAKRRPRGAASAAPRASVRAATAARGWFVQVQGAGTMCTFAPPPGMPAEEEEWPFLQAQRVRRCKAHSEGGAHRVAQGGRA